MISPLHKTPRPPQSGERDRAPGARIRWLYQKCRPLRGTLEHLGLYGLAQDRASDWVASSCPIERAEITLVYQNERNMALERAFWLVAVDTVLHVFLAKCVLGVYAGLSDVAHVATDHPWSIALLVGIVATVVRLRRKK